MSRNSACCGLSALARLLRAGRKRSKNRDEDERASHVRGRRIQPLRLLPFPGPGEALADMDLRDEIQKIALEWPSYGSRRITAELKARQWDVNRKRVQRIMREDNLLCVVKR